MKKIRNNMKKDQKQYEKYERIVKRYENYCKIGYNMKIEERADG